MAEITVPRTLDEAVLRPRMASQTQRALHAFQAELGGAESANASSAVVPLTAELAVGAIVVDSGVVVPESLLETWSVDAIAVVKRAVSSVLGTEFTDVALAREGTYLVQDPDLAGAILGSPDLLGGFAIDGSPVLFPIATDVLVVTGSDDVAGLITALNLVDNAIDRDERLVSAEAVTVSSEGWATFAWPAHPDLDRARAYVDARWTAAVYAWQKPLLEQYYADTGQEVFVAKVDAAADDDRAMTIATWSHGVTSVLPRADLIFLFTAEGETLVVPWDTLVAEQGALLAPTAFVPERYLVESFPDDAWIAALRRPAE